MTRFRQLPGYHTNGFQSTPSTRRVTSEISRNTSKCLFQSTPSTRRVTKPDGPHKAPDVISIHTLHTEGDAFIFAMTSSPLPFQSTPSTRRVTGDIITNNFMVVFQSTPSTRRVTRFPSMVTNHSAKTSIHTFHTEGDMVARRGSPSFQRFQSTPSTRRVTKVLLVS